MVDAIRVHKFGGQEVLQWEEVSLRDLRPDEVRLRHTAHRALERRRTVGSSILLR